MKLSFKNRNVQKIALGLLATVLTVPVLADAKPAFACIFPGQPCPRTPIPAPKLPKGEYRTNKFDLKAQVEGGGWVVVWGDDLSETDAASGVVAAGVSIYSSNPALFYKWVETLIDKTVYKISSNVPGSVQREAERIARDAIYSAIRGQSPKAIAKNFDTVDFKAGAIKYSGGNYLGGRQIGPATWGLKPYVAFRVRSSRRGGSNTNPTRTSRTSLINAGGMCLDVHAPDMRNNGGRVQVWQCNGEPQQQWSLRGNALVNAGGMCLDVHAPDMRNNGGRVQVWQCNREPQQQWSL